MDTFISKIRYVITWARQLRGKLWCPVCCKQVRKFEGLPAYFSENWTRHSFDLNVDRLETLNYRQYSCRWCHSSDRDRLFALYFQNIADQITANETAKFIEFAPIPALTQRLRSLFGNRIEYRTADLMMKGVDDVVDLCDMEHHYSDNSISAFLCSHVLEHVHDDRLALKELYRILRPGGQGVLLAPVHLDLPETRESQGSLTEAERWRYFGQGDHIRLYGKQDFEQKILDAGFIFRTVGREFFGEDKLIRNGLLPSSVLYLVTK